MVDLDAVLGGGLDVTSNAITSDVVMVHNSEAGSTFDADVLVGSTTRAADNSFLAMALQAASDPLFEVRGDGQTTIDNGLDVDLVGMTVGAGGFVATAGYVFRGNVGLPYFTLTMCGFRGVTINDGGLNVDAGGGSSTTGVRVLDGGSLVTHSAYRTAAMDLSATFASYATSVITTDVSCLGSISRKRTPCNRCVTGQRRRRNKSQYA